MSLSSLQVLADNRNALLLAELGALLHDVGKCTSEFAYFVQARSSNNHDPYKAIFTANELQRYVFSPQRIQERLDEANEQYALHTLLSNQVLQKLDASFRFSGNAYTLREAIYFSRPRFAGNIGRPLQRLGEPLDLLAYCHGEGHVEKEEPWPSRTPSPVARYSAFGVQLSVLPQPADSENLTKRLSAMDWDALIQKHSTKELRELFLNALGDTRFPINEVTLWDWSYAVASLFKSELARRFLTGEWRTRDNLRWRLLRVNLDVLGLYAKATKIADLLGYQEAIGKACEAVKQLVEEEYPLGNEVYRDTAGIYFTFPDRDLFPGLEQEIRRRVEAIEPELAPRIVVDPSEPLKALLSSSHNKVRQELAQPMMSENLSPDWQMQWDNLPDGKWELCPVCRLRPMREKREACEHCEGRRQSRIELWERDPSKTIWLDEIADHNDRMALIVGKFGLDDWLSGDLVQTLLVRAEENDPSRCTPKNPSPARLRRVWETCQRFWTETVEPILQTHQYAQNAALRRTRMIVIPDKKDGWKKGYPYDGTINSGVVSLLWLDEARYFVTISNLQLAAGEAKTVDALVQAWQGREMVVYDPANPRQKIPFKVQGAMPAMAPLSQYVPCLTLLTSPDQFLALVPASDALDLTSQIHDEHQKQFGKVQNRLPLFLGLAFFQRKTPLMAVMDTARRMVEQVELDEETWRIRDGVANGQVQFENGFTWTVPTKMGDGTTEDVWYPYFFAADGNNVSDRKLRFQLKREGEQDPQKVGEVSDRYANRWLVHVGNLNKDDIVRVTPSRFAYVYLEHTAQRFRFDPNRDVMLLDELPRLRRMWKALQQSGITDTGLRGVQILLETKGAAWGTTSQEFEQLANTTLKQAKLFKCKDTDGNPVPDVVKPEDVTSGRFHRCLELHTKILKLRVKGKEEKNE